MQTVFRVLSIVGLLAVGVVLWPRQVVDEGESRAIAEGRTVVVYWDRHSGHEYDARLALIEEFNALQDEIYVRSVPIGINALMEKILTATAGNAPPDICSLDAVLLLQLAPQGILKPLDAILADAPALREEAFLPSAWKMVHFEGQTWALPTSTDTYCLLWNKAAFRAAGLDPERPPKNIEELKDYAARLTIRNEDGGIEQMGFLPWLPWDISHLWGSVFGGRWYDDESGLAMTSQSPPIAASLAFQQSFTLDPEAETQLPYAMEVERVAAFTRSIGEYMSPNNPFYSGKVAMIIEGEWQVTFIPKYAPGLEWGVAPIPRPEGAPRIGYSPTLVADAIPATSRNPEAAAKFLLWFSSPRPGGKPSPASDYSYAIHNIPCLKEEVLQPRFTEDPKFKLFIDEALQPVVRTYPVCPAGFFFTDTIERTREQIIYRKITPEEGVRHMDASINKELARVRALLARSAHDPQ
jgi:multiple sugar transport system substrate-binding protein